MFFMIPYLPLRHVMCSCVIYHNLLSIQNGFQLTLGWPHKTLAQKLHINIRFSNTKFNNWIFHRIMITILHCWSLYTTKKAHGMLLENLAFKNYVPYYVSITHVVISTIVKGKSYWTLVSTRLRTMAHVTFT